MEYVCRDITGSGTCKDWTGSIQWASADGDVLEAVLAARGSSFYVIAGEYMYGWYLCIPEWGIGSSLTRPDDVFWNQEQLRKYMEHVDAVSVSCGLAEIYKLVKKGAVV